MGNCCCGQPVDDEEEFQKGRHFVADNKIFTLRKYGNADNNDIPTDPYVKGCNGKFESFKEVSPDKNSNIKGRKKRSLRKSKRSSAKKSNNSNDKEFVRTTSMEEFCNDVAYLQSSS